MVCAFPVAAAHGSASQAPSAADETLKRIRELESLLKRTESEDELEKLSPSAAESKAPGGGGGGKRKKKKEKASKQPKAKAKRGGGRGRTLVVKEPKYHPLAVK
jgi:hypothetical protein